MTDEGFFTEAKKCYGRLRRNWLLRFLRTPKSVEYIKFRYQPLRIKKCWAGKRVSQDHNLGIIRKELPPESEVRDRRYLYDPCPLDDPIPTNHFLHALLHPGCYQEAILHPKAPKKLNSRIVGRAPRGTDEKNPIGWAIHIEEGPDLLGTVLYIFAVVCVSLLFVVTWSEYGPGGPSEALSIGQMIAGMLSVLFMLVPVYYSTA
jgi:hypothetical protein